VEVLGGSTRVPAVLRLLESVFGKVPSRTLHTKEVVSRGAALQCAMISPLIKVCAPRCVCLWGGGGRGRGWVAGWLGVLHNALPLHASRRAWMLARVLPHPGPKHRLTPSL
jgi:molecular chaperone DnaK (HSP70)